MKLSREKTVALGIVLSLIVFLFLISMCLPSEQLKIGSSSLASLNEHWTILINDSQYTDQSLPYIQKVPAGETYETYTVLGSDFNQAQTLRIRSSMQLIEVYLDGEHLFKNQTSESFHSFLTVPEVSAWYFVEIPANSAGKEIRVKYASEVQSFSGRINSVYYGDADALALDIIRSQNGGLVIGLLLLGIGIIALGLFFSLPSIEDSRMLYLSLFAFSTGLWIISEMKMMQLFTGNRFFISGISYIALSVIPVSFCLYLKRVVLPRYKAILNGFICIFFVLFFVDLAIQFLGIMHFVEIITLNNFFMLIGIFTTMFLLLYESIHYKNKQAQKFALYLSMLVAVVSFEIIQFFSENFNVISYLSRFGLIFFFILLLLDTSRYISMLIQSRKEAEIFERLAYMDILTGAGNRTAFEKAVHEWTRDTSMMKYRLALFDINYLKRINDHFGHKAGDLAIIKSHHCIDEIFRDIGTCYRLGGDEFACIMSNIDETEYHKRIIRMKELLIRESGDLPFELSVSSGSLEYSEHDSSDFDAFFDKVDQILYKNKNSYKESL